MLVLRCRFASLHLLRKRELVALFVLSYDVSSGSDITSCIKIDKPLLVYIFHNITK